MAWAFATVNQRAKKLFAALARAAELHMSSFDPQGLANAFWVAATVTQKDY